MYHVVEHSAWRAVSVWEEQLFPLPCNLICVIGEDIGGQYTMCTPSLTAWSIFKSEDKEEAIGYAMLESLKF